MLNFTMKHRFVLVLALIIGLTTACKKDDDAAPAPSSTPGYRTTTIDYNTLTPTTSYKTTFLLSNGDSTINRLDGLNRLRMFRALAAYVSSATTAPIDSTTLSNMFANKNNAFSGIYADLNDVDFSIKGATASSKVNQSDVHHDLEVAFGRMAYISTKAGQTAVKGTAGKTGTYLVDENGIEWAQIIQKTLIGGYHLDYIGNILLNYGLNADNKNLVPGKKYTALEHNWDEAYGFLSPNDIYGINATARDASPARSNEFYLGSYVWEYNEIGFAKLHLAFLKGRAAIHNNDMNEVRAQATIIRDIFEKAIGGAAEGYMYKSTLSTSTDAQRAHAFGEGFGFVYSTRFCTQTGADDAFSTGLKAGLINPTTPTFYDITVTQFTAARNAIMAKFGLVIVH